MGLDPQFPAQVCARQCATCIFGPRTPITRERFAQLAAVWAKMRGSHQTCHAFGTTEGGKDVWCAGFWETQVDDDHRLLFERLGYVTFVDPDNA